MFINDLVCAFFCTVNDRESAGTSLFLCSGLSIKQEGLVQ